MANVNVRQRPNDRWECRWQALDGRRRGRSLQSKAEAGAFRDGIFREQVLLGQKGSAQITVATFVNEKWWPAWRHESQRRQQLGGRPRYETTFSLTSISDG